MSLNVVSRSESRDFKPGISSDSPLCANCMKLCYVSRSRRFENHESRKLSLPILFGKGLDEETASERRLPTSAKASRRIVVRASLGNLEFMSPINSCDFADRFSDLGSRLPILPSLPVLLSPSFYPFLSLSCSFLTGAFQHSTGSFPSMNPSSWLAVSLLLIIK